MPAWTQSCLTSVWEVIWSVLRCKLKLGSAKHALCLLCKLQWSVNVSSVHLIACTAEMCRFYSANLTINLLLVGVSANLLFKQGTQAGEMYNCWLNCRQYLFSWNSKRNKVQIQTPCKLKNLVIETKLLTSFKVACPNILFSHHDQL